MPQRYNIKIKGRTFRGGKALPFSNIYYPSLNVILNVVKDLNAISGCIQILHYVQNDKG